MGESLLVTLGVHVDSSKDNVSLRFLVEPRFLPKLQTTRLTGLDIAPAGAIGLE